MVEIFSIGGGSPCPMIPTPYPSTVAEAQAATMCKPLMSLGPTTNYCAGSQSCTGGGSEIVIDDSQRVVSQGEGIGERAYFEGDPYQVLPRRSPTARSRASLPRVEIDDLPDLLATLVRQNPGLAGMEGLTVSLRRTFYEEGRNPMVNDHIFHGVVLGDGAFTLESPRIARDRGQSRPYIEIEGLSGTSLAGDLIIVAGTITCAAGYVAGGKLSKELGTYPTTFWGLAMALIVLVPTFLVIRGRTDWGAVPLEGWLGIAWMTFLSSLAGYGLWFFALGRGGIGRIGSLQLAMPVVTLSAAVIVLGESISGALALAGLAVVSGTFFAQRELD